MTMKWLVRSRGGGFSVWGLPVVWADASHSQTSEDSYLPFAYLASFWMKISKTRVGQVCSHIQAKWQCSKVFFFFPLRNVVVQPRLAVFWLPFELLSCGVAHSKKGLQYPTPSTILAHVIASKASKHTSDFWPRRAWSSDAWQAGWRKCCTAGMTSKHVRSGRGVGQCTRDVWQDCKVAACAVWEA